MKTVYRVFRMDSSPSFHMKGTYTLFPVHDELGQQIKEFGSPEEAEQLIERLLRIDFGPYTILTLYTQND